MAGGGLMQLVAYGAQDVYLSGKPEITFFKAVYKRHTNFAIECIPQTFLGNPGSGKTVACPLTRNGDLITNMILKCTIEGTAGVNTAIPSPHANWSWCDNVGFALIDNVELDNIMTSFFIISCKTFEPLELTGNKFNLNLLNLEFSSLRVSECD